MIKRIGLLALPVVLAVASVPLGVRADTDRVNLWPLLSIDDAGVDVIWPISHFKDSSHWRVFPVFRGWKSFVIFPEFWFFDDGFIVCPFGASYDFSNGTLFPVVWWDFKNEAHPMHSVFPLYYYNDSDGSTLFWAGCGLGGYNRKFDNSVNHWLLPLYIKDGEDFYSMPYSRFASGDGAVSAFMMGLAGYETSDAGDVESHWVFPLYGRGRRNFCSLPIALQWDDKDRLDGWMSPMLLSGGWRNGSEWKSRYLLGLAGGNSDENCGSWDSWLAPLYYANSKGTVVTPLFGQSESCAWGLPGWYKSERTFISPLWYHHLDDAGRFDRWMIPFLLSGGSYADGCDRNFLLLNLAGWRSEDSGFFSSWFFPLYYADNTGRFITPLYGRTANSQWCLPLWYNDGRSVYSPFWCQTDDEHGNLQSWKIPVLLSGGGYNGEGTYEIDVLLGLGGASWRPGYRSSWAFPLYYEDSDGTLVTPLYGHNRSATWLIPLFYSSNKGFLSLPYAYCRNEAAKQSSYIFPPLLSAYMKYDDGGDKLYLMALYGHGTQADGALDFDYLFPFYYYDSKGDSFASLIYGHDSEYTNRGLSTYHWWMTPLVGTRSGAKTGGWFFPFFNMVEDASFESDLACMDSETNLCATRTVDSSSSGSVLLFSDIVHSVRGSAGKNTYTLQESSKRGNVLFFNHSAYRTVDYDNATGRKTDDCRSSNTTALLGIFNRQSRSNAKKGTSYTHTRVLWKLWDRKEKNGDVTLDVFPGFTYDSKTSGYTKTSFLWRFFRYESDPKEGTKVDLLFIPVWR